MPQSGASTITFKLKDWTGPAGRSYIQGVKWDGYQFFLFQSDPDGPREHVVARRHNVDGKYLDSHTFTNAGHGSSTGVQRQDDGTTRIWLGHKELGVGYYVYGVDGFHKVPGVPNGDITLDADHNLLCVRNGSRYRGYTLSSVETGIPVAVFDGQIRDWFKRFQGHTVTRLDNGDTAVLVHRDMATKGRSRLDAFKVVYGELEKFAEYDTTNWGDEAEGAMVYDGAVWSTSRVGGTGSGRTVVATRLPLNVWPPPYLPPMMVDPAKVTTFLWAVKHSTSEPTHKRPPGFVIDTGIKFITVPGSDRRWLLTEAGYRYAADYLKEV